MTDIVHTTVESAKEKVSDIEKQIQNLVLDNNKKIDTNIEKTANLESMIVYMKNEKTQMKADSDKKHQQLLDILLNCTTTNVPPPPNVTGTL